MLKLTQYNFDLNLSNCAIISITNTTTNRLISKFEYPLTSDDYKIYIVTNNKQILYIGTTKDSIRNRIRSGLKGSGENGYHGYKWRNLESVSISVWNFKNYNKKQIESIEAELAFIVRCKTKKWPIFQNEIHFNNEFKPTGEIIANMLYKNLILGKRNKTNKY